MTNPNKSQLYERVAGALADNPSKQSIHSSAKIGAIGKNDQKAPHSRKGDGTTKIKNRNAFNPNKSYPVHIISKAVAKLA